MNFKKICSAALIGLVAFSCVKKNEELGKNYLETTQQYDVYTAEFDIDDIEMEYPDSLSAFSLYKFAIGAIRDEDFGLSKKATAFTLVPAHDTLDFGKPGTQVFKRFHFAAMPDSVSTADPLQAYILQNVNVYSLKRPLNYSSSKPVVDVDWERGRISKGVPVYSGKDTLSFDFTQEFGEEYLTACQSDMDSIITYTAKFPGIYIDTDLPQGNGGRINMFKLPVDVYNGYIYGSYAILSFSADYADRGVVDTSFVYYLGPLNIYKLDNVSTTSVTDYPQIAYNISEHETSALKGKVSDKAYFEGGQGIKPVIKARSIREKVLAEVTKHGDPRKILINKASLMLPYDFDPDHYEDISNFYPSVLSPTCRIANDTSVRFAGLSDASSSVENQGNINRSLNCYKPDVSHHIQELMRLEDESKVNDYDIWFLAMADEEVTSHQENSSSDMSDYYQSLMYNSYYNSMYNGYGGGYGGYGYGGGYYNNYYNYAMMAQYMSASQGAEYSTEKQSMLDNDRFYKAVLNGPAASGARPKLTIVYSIPKE